jgi:hypothetical protein
MSSKTNSEVSKELYEKMSKLYLLITKVFRNSALRTRFPATFCSWGAANAAPGCCCALCCCAAAIVPNCCASARITRADYLALSISNMGSNCLAIRSVRQMLDPRFDIGRRRLVGEFRSVSLSGRSLVDVGSVSAFPPRRSQTGTPAPSCRTPACSCE